MAAWSELCGVVVTYHPDEQVTENVRAMVGECGHVVVVDNGSTPAICARLAGIPGVEVIALGENLGVATALNRGARRAVAQGCRWVVTFDQDSRPQPGMIAALQATAEAQPGAAIVVPCVVEPDGSDYRWLRPRPQTRWLFQRIPCRGADLPAVTAAITSGSMVELKTWQELGGFEESFFIDYIDVEFCLRVIRSGRRVAVSSKAKLDHRLGNRAPGVFLGHAFRPMHHQAFRHYYIARNRVRVWRKHAMAVPHWALFDFCFANYNTFRVLAFEDRKWSKLKATFLGTWDGLKGKEGPCPEIRARAFR
ncbi:MAG: glycosyltransferase family 2 protein [Opitutaceae bacterium]